MSELRTALLHHIGAPGIGEHYDWLLAVDEPASEPLLAARCFRRPDEVGSDERLAFETLNAHRVMYLDYEGPISGGRGHVRQVAHGRYETRRPRPASTDLFPREFRVRWSGGVVQVWRVENETTLHCLERGAE
ncbi:MAG: hypothetical protein ACF8PN_16325 [Phycisphaerales bacterium]